MSKGNFLSTPQGKKMTGMAYGFGAALVIIGALFKIMHFPGAGIMLSIGMGVEAMLFAMSAFEEPHTEYDWSKVYPELGGGEATEKVAKPQAGGSLNLSGINALGQDDVEKLKDGIRKLGDTASQIADISGASTASATYVRNMNTASDAISAFASTQVGLKNSSDSLFQSYRTVAESMTAAASDAKGYMQEMQGITRNLSSINASYELQLKNIGSQAQMLESMTGDISKIKTTMTDAATETEAFKAQATKLTQQISSLNNVYGNMLNAFSTRV
jgi:gliding motility-associated protein GldL